MVVPIWLATANKLYECDDLGPLVNLPIFRSVNGNFTNVSFLFTKAVFPISWGVNLQKYENIIIDVYLFWDSFDSELMDWLEQCSDVLICRSSVFRIVNFYTSTEYFRNITTRVKNVGKSKHFLSLTFFLCPCRSLWINVQKPTEL